MLHASILGVHFSDFQGTYDLVYDHCYLVLCIIMWMHKAMHEWIHLFSSSNERGRFSTDGITLRNTTNSTFVQCTSTHLTSFAVLVDTSGKNVSPATYGIYICGYKSNNNGYICTVYV